ncbi:MAG TPA: ATP-binding protein [Candidatus Methylacidiphilales bacterium]|nr:ATP-binding protein [Candidatus Methylacidiphilales bacterium]
MVNFASSIRARLITCLVGSICLLFLLALYLQYSLKMTSQSNPDLGSRMSYLAHLESVPPMLTVMCVSAEGYARTGDPRYLQSYYESKAIMNRALYDADLLMAGERFGGKMDKQRRDLIDAWQKDFGAVIPVVAPNPVADEESRGEEAPPRSTVVEKPSVRAAPRTEADWERGRDMLRQIERLSDIIYSIVSSQVSVAKEAESLGAKYYVILMWIAVGFVGVFTVFIQQIISRSIISPLSSLGQAVRRLKAGEYAVRAPVSTSDEIGTLAVAFNSMAESIQENQRVLEVANRQLFSQQNELQNVNLDLERRVEEKTEELKKTLTSAESDATKLQMIINRMPDGLALLGERCRILSANAAALHILGHKDADSVQDWIDTKPGAFSFRQMNHLAVGREEMPFSRASRGDSFSNVALYLRGSDNQTRLVSFSGGPILFDPEGCVTLSVCIFRDVTLELALRQELEEKNIKLAEAARLKDEFLATLSHELRTPLTPVVSHAHLLLNTSRVSDEDTHSLRVIERNARALSRMIDELLDLSGIMNRKLRLLREPTKMKEWVQQTLETIRPACEKKQQTLHFHPCAEEICLQIDPARMTQVLVNLVTNAVKYTDNGGRIDVTLTASTHDILVQVRDNGSGLSRHDMREIFAMFHQTRASMTRRAGGLGIGLSVAKSLTELHGGDISVESDGPGQGSTFTVRLPREIRIATSERDGAGSGPAAENRVASSPAAEAYVDTDMHASTQTGGHNRKGVHLPQPSPGGDELQASNEPKQEAPAIATKSMSDAAASASPRVTADAGVSSRPDKRLLRGRRILLVEDSEDTLDALCRILRRRECEIYTANDGKTGLELARRERPEIILSDIGLPVMDGLEMARQIRMDPAMRHIIMVASSGLGRTQDIEAALAVGFAAHLLKPVDMAALDALLLRLLQPNAENALAEAGNGVASA